MSFLHFNHMHVLMAALVQWVLGALWYSPVLFANPWTAMVEVRPEAKGSRMAIGMIASFIGSLVVSFLLMHVVWWSGAYGFKQGARVGFILWAGFIFVPLAAQYLYEGRPFKLFAANTGYWLVALMMSGALLAHWG